MPVHFELSHSPSYQGGFLSIGNFDGVHRGHQSILESLVRHAQQHSVPACVLTFEPHPIRLLRPESVPPRLTNLRQKTELLHQSGVDHIVVYPTDQALLNLTANEFFQQIVVQHFAAKGLVEGPNFFFGKNRSGTIQTLKELCHLQGMSLEVIHPTLQATGMVSSSEIRKAIVDGNISSANEQLGRLYTVEGVVVTGDQRGRIIGFPTANLSGIETLIPANGVYAAFASWSHGEQENVMWPAAVNIGPNPTFGVEQRKVEAHLINFSGDLYRQPIRLTFLQRIREVETFPSIDELKHQVAKDIQTAKSIAEGFTDDG